MAAHSILAGTGRLKISSSVFRFLAFTELWYHTVVSWASPFAGKGCIAAGPLPLPPPQLARKGLLQYRLPQPLRPLKIRLTLLSLSQFEQVYESDHRDGFCAT